MLDKKFFYTLTAIGVVAAVAIGLSALPESKELAEIHEAVSGLEVESSPLAEPSQAKGESTYVMREKDGYIAVYRTGEEEPFLVLDTRVKFLPDYDRMLLARGIEVGSSEELAALIEDYIS